ncbi:hypothetical protein SRHO_G00264510 [Serrasalmus rhombeus]
MKVIEFWNYPHCRRWACRNQPYTPPRHSLATGVARLAVPSTLLKRPPLNETRLPAGKPIDSLLRADCSLWERGWGRRSQPCRPNPPPGIEWDLAGVNIQHFAPHEWAAKDPR